MSSLSYFNTLPARRRGSNSASKSRRSHPGFVLDTHHYRSICATPLSRIMQLSSRALRLAADEIPDVVAVFEALHRLLHREVARAGKVDAHLFADASGASGEDDDAVAEEYGLFDVVGDEDDGLARALPELDQLFLHGLARLRIEGTEGLVHQQHLGIDRQHARERHALLHSARQLGGVVIAEVVEVHHLQVLADGGVDLRARRALGLEAPADVAGHGAPGEKRELLEHHAAVRAGAVDLLAVHPDAAAALGLDEAAEDVQEGALAAAARTDDGDELALAHAEPLDVEDRQRLAVPGIDLPDAGSLQRNHWSRSTGHPCFDRSNFTPASWYFFSKKSRPSSFERSTGGGGCGLAPAALTRASAPSRSSTCTPKWSRP